MSYIIDSNALANATHTVANPTALHNVAFHWLSNRYMQLASGFMQLAAAGCKRNIVHFHCLFEGKLLIMH